MTSGDGLPAASRFETVNPTTGEAIESFTYHSAQDTERALQRAAAAFERFRSTSPFARARLLSGLAECLRRRRGEIAHLITREMGKVIGESEAEIDKCADEADWYAEHGPSMLADEPARTGRIDAFVSYRPLGPVLGIMPWNFPFWQATRFALPTLLAGNVVLIKHSPTTQRCALELEKLFLEAGFPEGVLQNLILPVRDVAEVIRDDRIRGVSVTGSVGAGSAVASEAGKAVKPSALELGGSDAFIVLEDADIEGAVKAGVRGRFGNAGQVCLAAKRFLLADPIADDFESRFARAVGALRIGDPFDRSSDLGPMARTDLRDELDRQVRASVALGAKIVCGGRKVDGPGAFYEPTILTGVTPGMPVFDEETFGPVASVTRVPNAKAALELANASIYGLSGNIWTRDVDLARNMARDWQTGGVFINGVTASNPRVPVGGVKKSGYGRELSHFGVRAFVNAQTVWLDDTPAEEGSTFPA